MSFYDAARGSVLDELVSGDNAKSQNRKVRSRQCTGKTFAGDFSAQVTQKVARERFACVLAEHQFAEARWTSWYREIMQKVKAEKRVRASAQAKRLSVTFRPKCRKRAPRAMEIHAFLRRRSRKRVVRVGHGR